MKITIDNCQACEPIDKTIKELLEIGYKILESRLEDYHFHQLYFKIDANFGILKDNDISGFTTKDNFLICNCHWSTIEFFQSEIIES